MLVQMDKAQTNEAFAAATGRPASTFGKIGASLQPTRWGMPGGQGGGQNTRHANAPYLAGMVFGCAAYQPKDGHEVATAAAVVTINGLPSISRQMGRVASSVATRRWLTFLS
jgi:hypothetical protein